MRCGESSPASNRPRSPFARRNTAAAGRGLHRPESTASLRFDGTTAVSGPDLRCPEAENPAGGHLPRSGCALATEMAGVAFRNGSGESFPPPAGRETDRLRPRVPGWTTACRSEPVQQPLEVVELGFRTFALAGTAPDFVKNLAGTVVEFTFGKRPSARDRRSLGT